MSQMNNVITHLRTLMVEADGACLTDGKLLECFVNCRDATALEALVRRHGPMVWGVCRRVLPNYHDVEDAFQATFLVLVRKAASITSRELIANWIYAVATQTALKARTTAGKRCTRERLVTVMPEPAVAEQDPWPDLRPLLDKELSRLPHKYRAVIVLCDLEGKTRKEAALQLGVPQGTIASRMATARSMLAKRLARHGLAVSGVALAAGLTEMVASAGVPASVVSSTINAAKLLATGKTAGAISVKVISLTEGVIKAMMFTKIKRAALFLILGIVALGGGLFILPTEAAQKKGEKPANRQTVKVEVRAEEEKPADLHDKAKKPRWRMDLEGHDSPVVSLAYSPDGQTLASGSMDKTIKLWDLKTGKESATLKGHKDTVHSVAYSPDGKTLASGSTDRTIKLWDVKTGKELATLEGHAHSVNSVAYSPDGKTLASGSWDHTIKLWDAGTGKELATFKGHTGGVGSIVFSPDGKTLASASEDHTFKLWDLKTGKDIATFKDSKGGPHFAFSPDGKTLVCDDGNGVKFWDVKTGKELPASNKTFWESYSVAYSPNGKTLALGAAMKSFCWTRQRARNCSISTVVDKWRFTPWRTVGTASCWPRPARIRRSKCGICSP